MGADFHACCEMMRSRLGANPVAIQLPIGSEDSFRGIIDLVSMKANIYHDDDGRVFEVCDIPEELRDEAEEYHQLLLDAVAEFDDDLMEKYLSDEPIAEEDIIKAIRRGTLAAAINPVLCGSSFKNKGVQQLLDAIVEYLPSPLDVPAIKGTGPDGEEVERRSSDDEPFAALAFKLLPTPMWAA